MNTHVCFSCKSTAKHLDVDFPQILLFSKAISLDNFTTKNLTVIAIICSAGTL